MIQINTNIPAMVASRILNSQNESLNTTMMRLGTGLRINVGKDDPAGLIASEGLRAEKGAISAAMYNIGRADNVVASAEGGLDEINKLLVELEGLIDRSANEGAISADERNANQLEIDTILASIDRMASSNEFQGRKLLNGELDYTTSAVSTSNFDTLRINAAKIANDGYRSVVVEVVSAAETAGVTYAASTTTAGETTTIQVHGNLGTEVLTFSSSTAISAVADAVNQSTILTGVKATASSDNNLYFESSEYGSDQFVSVSALEGTFTITGADSGDRDYGKDAGVNINGVRALANGLSVQLQTSTLALEMDLSETFGTPSSGTNTSTFYVTGGGADFMISPTVSYAGLASLGIQAVSTSALGNGALGYLSSLGSGQTNALDQGNYSTAQSIVRLAQGQISRLRGRLGAFQKDTLETTRNSLETTLENVSAAEANIRETDFAHETSNMTRSQIMVQSAMSVLRIANAQPQQVLSLLG